MTVPQLIRKPVRLVAEDQHSAFRVAHAPQITPPFCGEEKGLAERRQGRGEGVPVRPHTGLDVLPIIEPGAADAFLVEREP